MTGKFSIKLTIVLLLILALPHIGVAVIMFYEDKVTYPNGYPFVKNGVGYDTTNPLVDVKNNTFINIQNLNKIVIALYKYENDHYAFPIREKFMSSPARDGEEWIQELVPKYIKKLPRIIDEKNNSKNFVYASDGVDFKLLAYGPHDCESVKKHFSQIIDIRKNCKGYGYWTKKYERY